MVRSRSRRVAAVVRVDYKYIILLHRRNDFRKSCIESLKPLAVSRRIISMSPPRVKFYKIGKNKSLVIFPHIAHSSVNTIHIILGVDCLGYSDTCENILDLAYTYDILPGILNVHKQIILRRKNGIISSVRCSLIIALCAFKRSCDNS